MIKYSPWLKRSFFGTQFTSVRGFHINICNEGLKEWFGVSDEIKYIRFYLTNRKSKSVYRITDIGCSVIYIEIDKVSKACFVYNSFTNWLKDNIDNVKNIKSTYIGLEYK